jgi:hypothetical protein
MIWKRAVFTNLFEPDRGRSHAYEPAADKPGEIYYLHLAGLRRGLASLG